MKKPTFKLAKTQHLKNLILTYIEQLINNDKKWLIEKDSFYFCLLHMCLLLRIQTLPYMTYKKAQRKLTESRD